ncbi:unnamed protein product [Nezara viridula]|uniref:Uncharacterized protein n=1 Tax=Nezara viridula TaxID=85310 RepID=A0A9P0HEJ5_NEZVI|nr:unnamed protein product [Nezara viridula]
MPNILFALFQRSAVKYYYSCYDYLTKGSTPKPPLHSHLDLPASVGKSGMDAKRGTDSAKIRILPPRDPHLLIHCVRIESGTRPRKQHELTHDQQFGMEAREQLRYVTGRTRFAYSDNRGSATQAGTVGSLHGYRQLSFVAIETLKWENLIKSQPLFHGELFLVRGNAISKALSLEG